MDIYKLYKQIKEEGILVTLTKNREKYLFYDGIVTCKIADGMVKAIVIEPSGYIKSIPAYAETDSVKESET
jgi:hypothetical protein